MPVEPAVLVKDDQDHLIHPLHHPSDHLEPMVYVRGRGATITDIQGREYIDGLAGLWNVNVGHGREELGRPPPSRSAARLLLGLHRLHRISRRSSSPQADHARLPEHARRVLHHGRRRVERVAFKTARFYWKSRESPTRSRSSPARWPITA